MTSLKGKIKEKGQVFTSLKVHLEKKERKKRKRARCVQTKLALNMCAEWQLEKS